MYLDVVKVRKLSERAFDLFVLFNVGRKALLRAAC